MYGLSLVLAVAYGAILSRVPNEQFKDFSNYLAYAKYSWQRLLDMFGEGVFVVLTNQPGWLLINPSLGACLPAEGVVRVIIFGSATLVASLVLRSDPRHFIWLLPTIFKNHLIHMRQGTGQGPDAVEGALTAQSGLVGRLYERCALPRCAIPGFQCPR